MILKVEVYASDSDEDSSPFVATGTMKIKELYEYDGKVEDFVENICMKYGVDIDFGGTDTEEELTVNGDILEANAQAFANKILYEVESYIKTI